MGTSRSEPPSVALVAGVRRGQAERLVGKFGRESRCSAIGRETRSVVEHGSDARVRRLGRERDVTGVEERIVDDARNTLVDAAPLLSQVLVKDRGQQRVREANRPVLALDYIGRERGPERICLNARPLEDRLRRCPQAEASASA